MVHTTFNNVINDVRTKLRYNKKINISFFLLQLYFKETRDQQMRHKIDE